MDTIKQAVISMINGIIILFHTDLYTDKLILSLWQILFALAHFRENMDSPILQVVLFSQSSSDGLWDYACSSDKLIQK